MSQYSMLPIKLLISDNITDRSMKSVGCTQGLIKLRQAKPFTCQRIVVLQALHGSWLQCVPAFKQRRQYYIKFRELSFA